MVSASEMRWKWPLNFTTSWEVSGRDQLERTGGGWLELQTYRRTRRAGEGGREEGLNSQSWKVEGKVLVNVSKGWPRVWMEGLCFQNWG